MKALRILALLAIILGLAGCGGSTPAESSSPYAPQKETTTTQYASSEDAHSPAPIRPDASLHPGATNQNVTQDNIQSTICVSGYTATIRPPTSYTNALKARQIKDEKLTGSAGDFEEDHLIALSIGGSPKDPRNLWPEPYESRASRLAPYPDGAEEKDKVENKLHADVCSGKKTLLEAQKAISTDWRALYVKEYGSGS